MTKSTAPAAVRLGQLLHWAGLLPREAKLCWDLEGAWVGLGSGLRLEQDTQQTTAHPWYSSPLRPSKLIYVSTMAYLMACRRNAPVFVGAPFLGVADWSAGMRQLRLPGVCRRAGQVEVPVTAPPPQPPTRQA